MIRMEMALRKKLDFAAMLRNIIDPIRFAEAARQDTSEEVNLLHIDMTSGMTLQ
jgi:hypothetical protein